MGTSFPQAKGFDLFNRTLAGTWGTSDSGHTWRTFAGLSTSADLGTSSDARLSVAPGEGKISIVNGEGKTRRDMMGTDARWQDVAAHFSLVGAITPSFGVVARANDSGTGYLFAMAPGGSSRVLGKVVNGVVTILATGGGVGSSIARIRLRVTPTKTYAYFGNNTANLYNGSVIPLEVDTPTDVNPSGRVGVVTENATGSNATYALDWFYYFDTSFGEEKQGNVSDVFNRTSPTGWGTSDSGHLWQGHVERSWMMSPLLLESGALASTSTAFLESSSGDDRVAMIGPTTTDQDVLARISNMQGNGSRVRVCARFDINRDTTMNPNRGYAARLVDGNDNVRLERWNGTGWTVIGGTGALGFTYDGTTHNVYVRLQCLGSTIRCRAWRGALEDEPASWMVSLTDTTWTSGRSGLYFEPAAAGNDLDVTQFYCDDLSASNANRGTWLYNTPSPSLAIHASTDTSVTVRQYYTEDTDNDNTIAFYRKLPSEESWTLISSTGTRVSGVTPKYWEYAHQGLSPNTAYDFKAVLADPDGIDRGAIATYGSAATTNNGTYAIGTPATNVVGSQIGVTCTYAADDNGNNSGSLYYRAQGSGTWLGPVAMGNDRGTKTLSTAITVADGDYELKVTVFDPNNSPTSQDSAVVAATVFTAVWETLTPSIALQVGGSTVTATVSYAADDNQNNAAELFYRVQGAGSWTSAGAMAVNRANRTFTLAKSALADATYEFKATITDADNAPTTLDTETDVAVVSTSRNFTSGPIVLGASAVTSTVTASATYADDDDGDNAAELFYRAVGSGTWISLGAMTADRPSKTFTKVAEGVPDGSMEFMATVTDPDNTPPGTIDSNVVGLEIATPLNEVVLDGDLAMSAVGSVVSASLSYLDDENENSTALLQYRAQGTATWTTAGSMTVDRAARVFSYAGLELADGEWEFRAQVSDADNSPSVITTAVESLSITNKSVLPLAIEAVPTAIAVSIVVEYGNDNNGNCSLTIQFRNIQDRYWTTVPEGDVALSRGAKTASAVVGSLRPATSYELRATFADPDGITAGGEATLTTTFTTLGIEQDTSFRGKHYRYKVYSWETDRHYLGTWPEAPEPTYGLQENGGVADLTITLPRTLSQAERDPTIDFGNQVDVWAIDYASEGMGRNLVLGGEFDAGGWTLDAGATLETTGGPDNGEALRIVASGGATVEAVSPVIDLGDPRDPDVPATLVPLVFSCYARGLGGKLEMVVDCYDVDGVLIESSDADLGLSTVGTEWQRLRAVYLPALGTRTLRVRFRNDGDGTYWADKVQARPQELLIYRGKIEGYTLYADADGQRVEVQALGLASVTNDDYIHFLQYASIQPARDLEGPNKFLNKPPTDPSQMLRDVLDVAAAQNPHFGLYYTASSIKDTDTTVEYTFRDQSVRSCMDKIRALCPAGWYYLIEPDGLVVLQGPDHAVTHTLRLNVEIQSYQNEKTISGLKNTIFIKGRQDEDRSESDGFGSINYLAQDPASIDRYGRRMHQIRDASVKDPSTAEILGEGRLEELNKPEQRATLYIPDEKDLRYAGSVLRGANIEQFQPGDFVRIVDPLSDERRTWWDEFVWDEDNWDDTGGRVLPEAVPIKGVQYQGTHCVLELSERPPSAVGDFARLVKLQQLNQGTGANDDDSF